MVDHIKITMPLTGQSSLKQLQHKTILLLCMATMWRPKSDIDRLQYQDIILQVEGIVYSVTLHVQESSKVQVKSTVLSEYMNKDLYPVRTLFKFITRTAVLRKAPRKDYALFLT
jgi:hypothetical protein